MATSGKPTGGATAAVIDRDDRVEIVHPREQVLVVDRWREQRDELPLTAGPDETIRAEPFDAVELRTSVLFGIEYDDDRDDA